MSNITQKRNILSTGRASGYQPTEGTGRAMATGRGQPSRAVQADRKGRRIMEDKLKALERVAKVETVEAACAWFGREERECLGCPAMGSGVPCIVCALADAAGVGVEAVRHGR